MPVGEKKTGLTPAIRFCDDITKKDGDEEAEQKYAIIKVKIDQNGTDDCVNLEDKKFLQILKDLTYAGLKGLRMIDIESKIGAVYCTDICILQRVGFNLVIRSPFKQAVQTTM